MHLLLGHAHLRTRLRITQTCIAQVACDVHLIDIFHEILFPRAKFCCCARCAASSHFSFSWGIVYEVRCGRIWGGMNSWIWRRGLLDLCVVQPGRWVFEWESCGHKRAIGLTQRFCLGPKAKLHASPSEKGLKSFVSQVFGTLLCHSHHSKCPFWPSDMAKAKGTRPLVSITVRNSLVLVYFLLQAYLAMRSVSDVYGYGISSTPPPDSATVLRGLLQNNLEGLEVTANCKNYRVIVLAFEGRAAAHLRGRPIWALSFSIPEGRPVA